MRRSYRPASSAKASASAAWARSINPASESDIDSSFQRFGPTFLNYQPIDTVFEIWLAARAKLCFDKGLEPLFDADSLLLICRAGESRSAPVIDNPSNESDACGQPADDPKSLSKLMKSSSL